MNSTVTKRSVVLAGGRKTSISLEDEFWNGLKAVARARSEHISAIVTQIDAKRTGNLSSAIRIAVLGFYQGMDKPAAPRTASVGAEAAPKC